MRVATLGTRRCVAVSPTRGSSGRLAKFLLSVLLCLFVGPPNHPLDNHPLVRLWTNPHPEELYVGEFSLGNETISSGERKQCWQKLCWQKQPYLLVVKPVHLHVLTITCEVSNELKPQPSTYNKRARTDIPVQPVCVYIYIYIYIVFIYLSKHVYTLCIYIYIYTHTYIHIC